jgi:hypothetical protein
VSDFRAEDFAEIGRLLREKSETGFRWEFYVVASNNLNIILAALDHAASATAGIVNVELLTRTGGTP